MVAPKRKNRYKLKFNFVDKKKKTLKIPFKLLKQIGGKKLLKKFKNKLN
jgi:hypothetical protein